MLHKSKVIGSRWLSITEARKAKVASSTQIEDDAGYGVGTIEYEIEVLGAGFPVCACNNMSSTSVPRSLTVHLCLDHITPAATS